MKKSTYQVWKYFLILTIPCLVFLTENCNENPDKKYLGTKDTVQIFHPLDRIFSQIDFARRLCEFYPDKKQYWNDLLNEANGFVNDFISDIDPLKLSEAIKRAESDNLIIRLIETEGKAVRANISFDPVVFGKIRKVTEIDLIERSISGSASENDDYSLSLDVPAFGISSVRVEM